jgi:NADPH:quinone reductase-like Zn-dependent oxidoreductase
MKAAVIFKKGNMPVYTTDFPEPVVSGNEEILISVKAAALKNLDKSMAHGTHYSTEKDDFSQAKVVGGDGVGILEDGRRVFAIGITGMLAERAVVDKRRLVNIPIEIDDATAAALPNAVAGSAMALLFRAKLKPGETVLINGATGFTGKIAVQIAKLYGAGRVIVTGRNAQALQSLLQIGADEIILLNEENKNFISALKELHKRTRIDVTLDYLWGRSAEAILQSLKGAGSFTHSTRFVSIGAVSGDQVSLSSEILRSTDLQVSGSGLGSWTREEMGQLFTTILPEMFRQVAAGNLKVDTISLPIQNIAQIWEMAVPSGKRLVVIVN